MIYLFPKVDACDGNLDVFVQKTLGVFVDNIPREILISKFSISRAELRDIRIKGAQNTKLGGDSCFSVMPDSISAQLIVELRDLNVKNKLSASLMGFALYGTTRTNIIYMRMKIGFQANSASKKIAFTDFVVEKIDGYDFEYDLNLPAFTKKMVSVFLTKDRIMNKVLNKTRDHLVETLEKFKSWDLLKLLIATLYNIA